MRLQKAILSLLLSVILLIPCFSFADNTVIPVRILLLPKFETGKMSGDDAGEAQLLYQEYCGGGDEYAIPGLPENQKLYYKNGIALVVCGEGKVNSALSLAAVLSDKRFDFSDAYIISYGCGGGAAGRAVIGDVVVVTAAVDKDLGHRADPRDMSDTDPETTWFHNPSFDSMACVTMNSELAQKVHRIAQTIPLDTSDDIRNIMDEYKKAYGIEVRPPKVITGTSVTSDNYWKGLHEHNNAVAVAEKYQCPDPYTVTEMEDVAIADTVRRFGMSDRLIVLRFVTNLDLFMPGLSPESVWDPNRKSNSRAEVKTSTDFFVPLTNHLKVTKAIIDAILDGSLEN